ncbi:GAP family protein [Microbacterium sp. AGC85]
MIDAIWQLVPVTLGVMASPIAITALAGILLSQHPRRNGVAYVIGWALCAAVLLTISLSVFRAAEAPGSYRDAEWMPLFHLTVGLICAGGAIWTYMRSRRVVERVAVATTPAQLADAAPQLPGLMRSVAHYTPPRSFLLGGAIFLSPMNIALVAAAGAEIVVAEFEPFVQNLFAAGFVAAAAAPVAAPVIMLLTLGERAAPLLGRLKDWMLRRNGLLTAGVLAVVAGLQIFKGIEGWVL